MALTARASAALALVLAAAGAAPPEGCAAAESDGVGLLQAAGRSAQVRSRSDAPGGGWVPRTATCAITDVECGTGCCGVTSTCTADQKCEKMFGDIVDPTPGKVGCPIAFNDHGDDGCCPAATLLGPPETCLELTCENILQYDCGIASGGSPTCTEGGEMPAGADFTMGIKATPKVYRTCTLDGKSCYEYSVNMAGFSITNSTSSPDCGHTSTRTTSTR
ncbi:unnamed protein product [Prorocentrum cordatum]|uniref:Uncharacterized protein n=1 Tax=Prorocentrum cordatum TaxID=2364126 RepID=A0ABN9X4V8_9DINO|nr:unnamed protein product [Polarella glacialis]